jgi:hypothetical protein
MSHIFKFLVSGTALPLLKRMHCGSVDSKQPLLQCSAHKLIIDSKLLPASVATTA